MGSRSFRIFIPSSEATIPCNGEIKNDKIIQVLAYAYMFGKEADGKPIEAGIISFKNLKSGFLPFSFKEGKEETTIISETIVNNYLEQMVLLVNTILDETIPFEEKIK